MKPGEQTLLHTISANDVTAIADAAASIAEDEGVRRESRNNTGAHRSAVWWDICVRDGGGRDKANSSRSSSSCSSGMITLFQGYRLAEPNPSPLLTDNRDSTRAHLMKEDKSTGLQSESAVQSVLTLSPPSSRNMQLYPLNTLLARTNSESL